MQNHMRNTMQFRKRSCDEGMQIKLWGVLCPSAVKNTEKDRKLKDFYFLNTCEEGESPRRLQWLGPSKPEFYGEYNGSKYNLRALALL